MRSLHLTEFKNTDSRATPYRHQLMLNILYSLGTSALEDCI